MGSRRPKNIGVIPDWHADRNKHTRIVLDAPMPAAPYLGTEFGIADYAQAVAHTGSLFVAAGLRPGERVAIVRENHFEMQLLAAAAARIGAVPAVISAANSSSDLVSLVQTLEPAVLAVTTTVAERMHCKERPLPSLAEHMVLLDAGRPDMDRFSGGSVLRWSDLAVRQPQPAHPVADDALMLITHTSGTTDTPKLVMHTAESLWAGTKVELLPVPGGVSRPDDTFLSSIAFGHSRAFTWVTAQFHWRPGRIVAVGDHGREVAERMFEATRPTIVESLPNVLQHWKPLVAERPDLFGQVRLYINTFDIMHSSIARPFLDASSHSTAMWAHSWGQSEVGPIAAGIFTKASFRHADRRGQELQMGKLGLPWPGLIKLRVVDPDTGAPSPRGKAGLIQVRSRSIAVGYFGEMSRYHAKWSDGWWNTGDYGYRDEIGRVHFLDRGMDRLNGDSAVEIESILLERLEEYDEVVVLPHGENPYVPVLCLRPGKTFDAGRWQTAVSDLPSLSDPVLVPMEDLPRTSTWKVRRHQLRGEIDSIEQSTTRSLDRRFI